MTVTILDLLELKADVLQIGFINADMASVIQAHHPKTHVIIEGRAERFLAAHKWGKKNRQARVLQGNWQTVLPPLGKFHAIVYEENESEVLAPLNMSRAETDHAHSLLQKGSQLFELVEEKVPGLAEQKYTDQDLEEFCQQFASTEQAHVAHFMAELKVRGQISPKQYEQISSRYKLPEVSISVPRGKAKASNPLFPLVAACLKHLDAGGRFAALLKGDVSNFEDPQFFENIVTNPHWDYQEKRVNLSLNRQCSAMLIENLSHS